MHPIAQSDPLQQGTGGFAEVGRDSGGQKRDQHIVECREVAQQIEVLKHEPNLTPAKLIPFPRAEFPQGASENTDRSGVGSVEPAQQVEQAALATPRGSHDERQAATGDFAGQAPQRLHGDGPPPVGLFEIPHGDRRGPNGLGINHGGLPPWGSSGRLVRRGTAPPGFPAPR